jgi:hypothetical protein
MSTTADAPDQVATTLTEAEIDAAVENFRKSLTEWETSAMVGRSPSLVAIDAPLIGSATVMFTTLERSGPEDAPQSRMELLLMLETFREKLAAWIEEPDRLGRNDKDPSGGFVLWGHWHEALRHKQPRRPREAPAPVWQQLSAYVDELGIGRLHADEGVARHYLSTPAMENGGIDGQRVREVARQMGWRNQFGEPDCDRVLRELSTPGSEYDASSWKDQKFEKYKADLLDRFGRHRDRIICRRGRPILPPFYGSSGGIASRPARFFSR